ncbi:MAG: OmpA family protein [Pseudarcicella sp.]|nr:OmpA family protein [Pseudarcicella sp.]
MKYCIFLLVFIFGLLSIDSTAQKGSILADAEKQYDLSNYSQATRKYEQSLKFESYLHSQTVKFDLYLKLAKSYRQLNDPKSEEKALRELFKLNFPMTGDNIIQFANFAQVLARNGKLEESQIYYDMYLQRKSAILPQGFRVLNQDSVSQLNNNYTLTYLNLNTSHPEFCPTYFKKGIVFVSGGNNLGEIENVLDLRYTDNIYSVQKNDTRSLSKQETKKVDKVSEEDKAALETHKVMMFGKKSKASQLNATVEQDIFGINVNSPQPEGQVAFTSDYNRIVFTRLNVFEGNYSPYKFNSVKAKLYTSFFESGAWSKSVELPFNSIEYSTANPTFTPDGRFMVFSSDMKSPGKEHDLYIVSYENGQWGKPLDLGETVNTKGNELFPFIDEAGNLYFSSDGRQGLGGLDIFYVKMFEGKPVGTPLNIGLPFNSMHEDYGILTDGNRTSGFISSNRSKGFDDDIYAFKYMGTLNTECKDIILVVTDQVEHLPVENAKVDVKINGVFSETKYTNSDGTIKVCSDHNQNYEFQITKEGCIKNDIGYLAKSNGKPDFSPSKLLVEIIKLPGFQKEEKLDVKKTEPLVATKVKKVKKPQEKVKTLSSKDFEEGDVLTIDNIYYELGESSLRKETAKELQKLVSTLNKHPKMVIELGSHTDSRGDASENKLLSTKRAQEAADYIISLGIDKNRVYANGYGESKPTNECVDGVSCTEKEHQKNRRTTVKILKTR